MQAILDFLQWLQTLVFLAVAGWALYRWRSRRNEASRWLAATFGSIGLVVLVGRALDYLPETAVTDVIQQFVIALLVLFPYLLVRFLDSFEPVHRPVRITLGWLVIAMAVAALAISGPEPGEPRSGAFSALAFVVAGTWLVALPYVGARFWRAGRGQPTLVRRRLRLLAVASVVLSLALLLAVLNNEGGDLLVLSTHLVAIASAGLFLLGFAPPGPLRRLWRHPEEQELHGAALGLMAATSPAEVAEVLLPHLKRVVGARGVAMVHDGTVLGADGVAAEEQRTLTEGQSTAELRTELADGALHLWVDPYTPFFGTEELDLLERMGLLADLAIDRATLLVSERESRAALEHANAELESFVYSASHDLKSPLIAMLGYIDLLAEGHQQDLGEEGRWFLDRMSSNGRYMEALIRDLLELSRVGRMETAPERVDVGELVADIATEVAQQYPEASVRAGDLPVLWMNGVRARQLLANLIENAAKHAGGRAVTISVTAESTESPDGGVVLRVADDGDGIPEAYRELVFGVFERLAPDDAHTGTGIGLAICRKIVEASGGRIWVGSPAEGAEFAMQFPADMVRSPLSTTEEVPA